MSEPRVSRNASAGSRRRKATTGSCCCVSRTWRTTRLWCHRRVFTAWWKDVTGDTVRELGPMAEGLPYPSGCGAGGP
jgi:hypothetical protein